MTGDAGGKEDREKQQSGKTNFWSPRIRKHAYIVAKNYNMLRVVL